MDEFTHEGKYCDKETLKHVCECGTQDVRGCNHATWCPMFVEPDFKKPSHQCDGYLTEMELIVAGCKICHTDEPAYCPRCNMCCACGTRNDGSVEKISGGRKNIFSWSNENPDIVKYKNDVKRICRRLTGAFFHDEQSAVRSIKTVINRLEEQGRISSGLVARDILNAAKSLNIAFSCAPDAIQFREYIL